MLLSRRTSVCVLASLFLPILGLGGGLWWFKKEPLNDTERRLVGVWETVDYSGDSVAIAFLSDSRAFPVRKVNGKWGIKPAPDTLWHASPEFIALLWPPPIPTSISVTDWHDFLLARSSGHYGLSYDLSFTSEVEMQFETASYRRSHDPELLRIFEKLSAGESP